MFLLLDHFFPGWAHSFLSRASKVVTLPYTIQPVVVMDTDSKMECGWIKHGGLGKVIRLYVQEQSVNAAHKSPLGLFCEAVLILPLIKGLRWGVRTLGCDGRFQSRSCQYLNDLRTIVYVVTRTLCCFGLFSTWGFLKKVLLVIN